MQDNSLLGSKITVCLLTYNYSHLLESTLASIQQQTLTGYDIIVSDDCSTDDTWPLLQRLAAADPRIRPIRTPSNLGMPGNANFAVAQTDRPYIALLHHDDLCRADLLEHWAGVMERHPEVGFVFNAYAHEGGKVFGQPVRIGEYIDGDQLLEHYLLPRWDSIIRGTALIRREAWTTVGGMRPEFGLLADIDLWMRLAMRGPVGYVDQTVLLVRQDRPADYPDEYASGWSWPRRRYLYDIHAANRRAYYALNTLQGRWRWWQFRLRLSLETAKWLTYAVVRKKPRMIIDSHGSVTDYDLWPLCLYRWLLQQAYKYVNAP